jgi:protein-tyrosine phosphatase
MRILTVCLGNICRSPMAEGVLRHLARERGLMISTDSAGTGNWHAGEAPDRRAQAAMRRQGMDISDLRARQVRVSDLEAFDLILAMDAENLSELQRVLVGEGKDRKLRLIMDYAPQHPQREVPDPYYGTDADFDAVYHMLVEAVNGLLDQLEDRS